MTSEKRKRNTHITEILDNAEQEDLLGVCEESDNDFVDDDNSPAASEDEATINPYQFHQDENPVTNDPYYYDQNELLQTKTAFYKSQNGGDQANLDNSIASTDESSSEEDSDDDSSSEFDIGDIENNRLKAVANNEYEADSSDEDEIVNTVGDIPLSWYEEYDHLGYDVGGEKILKPDRGDSLDEFLKRMDDPDYSRKVVDRLSGQDVKLVDGDLERVHRVLKGLVPSAQYNLFEKFEDIYSHEVMETPLSGRPEHKRSFVPSMSDRKLVSKMVSAIKRGAIHQHIRPKRYNVSHDLWNHDTIPVPMKRRVHPQYKAPPVKLPTNMNSYNPPVEFLLNRQARDWIDSKSEKEKELIEPRLAKKYDSVRGIPTDDKFVMNVFNRCLDLHLCSRVAIKRPVGRAKDLLPDLPRPRDLRPYPTKECLLFKGHQSIIRSISVHPSGHWLASGSDDHTVKIWNTSNSRCMRTLQVKDSVTCLAWCPNPDVFILAVAVGKCVVLINPESYLVANSIITRTNAVLKSQPDQGDYITPEKVKKAVTWTLPSDEEREQGYRMVLKHAFNVTQVAWHQQGDFFASLQPSGRTIAIVTHQLSRWRSQVPFAKASIGATAISFHPKKPYFYICTHGRIRVYSLLQRKLHRLIKTTSPNNIMSSIAVHPTGEHFITGSHGRRVTWYEMENTAEPFTLRYHHGVVRSVAYHKKYPLFASASDDGRVIVSHGMVYKDLIKDPLLVPVKELRNHEYFDSLCVLNIEWHPHEPLLFTAGADGTIRMWQ